MHDRSHPIHAISFWRLDNEPALRPIMGTAIQLSCVFVTQNSSAEHAFENRVNVLGVVTKIELFSNFRLREG